MFIEDQEREVRRLEEQFLLELTELERRFPRHHYHRISEKTTLAFTDITLFNKQKIGGIIMDFTLNQANPSVQLLVQALKGGAILPAVDAVTGHDTIKDGTLQITGDANIVVTQDPTNPLLVTVSRANNTTNAVSVLTANAQNDAGAPITGTSKITVVSDPVVDNGIADALQFVAAPVASAPAASAPAAAGTTQG
jgi:hypothetical protein